MQNPDLQPSRPPRGAGQGLVRTVIVLAVLVVGFFVMRQFWHADEQQEDPASVTAPDGGRVEGQAPAE
ncbi:hypothetical protein [Paracoccus laeviglucosivorans]|uniref:Uncharacterized protein n=1 Tax=Paracoccus laeviglucosivorans TaxID=1197861 RepID=A0A521EPP9_9RHOB|nr:hypothetical protein [Paracoccus laeviglucosivorans]SMO85882.1 hypothetical protein SAMN06265221_11482 [Paracoccus laeviglucosivorans]